MSAIQPTNKKPQVSGQVKPKAEKISKRVSGTVSYDVYDLRTRMEVSREELGSMTGFQPETIAQWEKRKRVSVGASIPLEKVDRLAKALKTILGANLSTWLNSENPAFENDARLISWQKVNPIASGK